MPVTRCWHLSNGWKGSTTKRWTIAAWFYNRSKPIRLFNCQRIRMSVPVGRWASGTSFSVKGLASSWRPWEPKRVTTPPYPSSRRGVDGIFDVAGQQSNASSSFEWAEMQIIRQCRLTMLEIYKTIKSLVAPLTSILIAVTFQIQWFWI